MTAQDALLIFPRRVHDLFKQHPGRPLVPNVRRYETPDGIYAALYRNISKFIC